MEPQGPEKGQDSAVAYSQAGMQHNAFLLSYCRTSIAALAGCAAGVLGLLGFWGFLFYIFASALLSSLLLLKAGNRWQRFFLSRSAIFTNGLLGELFTYILAWTFLYGMVHVYWIKSSLLLIKVLIFVKMWVWYFHLRLQHIYERKWKCQTFLFHLMIFENIFSIARYLYFKCNADKGLRTPRRYYFNKKLSSFVKFQRTRGMHYSKAHSKAHAEVEFISKEIVFIDCYTFYLM